METFLRSTPNVETFHMSCSTIFPILVDNPEILPNLQHLAVKISIFCEHYPFSTTLTNRSSVTLSVQGDFMQDGERLYNALDTHNAATPGV